MFFMVYVGVLFVDVCLCVKNGEVNIVECTYVEFKIIDVAFFVFKVMFGCDGVDIIYGFGFFIVYE